MSEIDKKISVVMPVYNANRFLSDAIESVLNQSYVDFEFIIIDDCSSDNSYEIMKKYAQSDDRVKIFKNEQNRGVSYTRNFGVSKATGDYVALIDSDDMWECDKLQKQMSVMQMFPDTDICFTGSAFIDTKSVRSTFVFRIPTLVDYKTLLKQNVISCSSVLIKRELLVKYPMAHDDMHEDYVVWLSVLKNGGVARGVDEPLLVYRVDRQSKSGNKFKSLKMGYKVYKYIGLNIFQIGYYMMHYVVRGIRKHGSI